MPGIDLTYRTLARTRNEAAIEVLRLATLDPDPAIRSRALESLLGRDEFRCRQLVLARWKGLADRDRKTVIRRARWLEPAVSAALEGGGLVSAAVDVASEAEMFAMLPKLIAVAEGDDPATGEEALIAAMAMAVSLGGDARRDHDRPSLRGPALHRLGSLVRQATDATDPRLLDAFLAIATWSDGELRDLLDEETTRGRLAQRLATSERLPVLQLLAGFVRRRDMPPAVAAVIAARSDDGFRDVLLETVGGNPGETVFKNLQQIGTPACCKRPDGFWERLGPESRAGLAHVAAATYVDPVWAMQLACRLAEDGGRGGERAAANVLGRFQIPDADIWLRAAGTVAEGDPRRIRDDENAQLLERLIRLLDRAYSPLVNQIRRLLRPLHAEHALPRFERLRPRSRRRLGRVVRMVDPDAIERIRERLRHPVLAQRLEAIAAAESLAAVDDLLEPLSAVARGDHQEARRRAAQALGEGEGEASLKVLEEMAEFPDSAVRDAALAAIRRRHLSLPAIVTLFLPLPDCRPMVQTLLVGQTRMSEVSRYYQETGTATPWATQFLFVLVPVLALGASWLTYRWWQRPPKACNTPFGMLGEITSVHGFSAATRRALERVAEYAELEQPAVLATSPSAFDRAVSKAEEARGLNDRIRERLGEARRRLFA